MRGRNVHTSAATTRTARRAGAAPAAMPPAVSITLLRPGDVIASPETQLQYAIERLLGHGGFGQVFLARRVGRSSIVPARVCIKVSARIDGWLREAYFGQLL